ncbi:MULE transposase domain-containing protein [Trichomonas vaginalis G3]|uniref:MULE transposase domain-containing protein n=1 Tax=Trichomonas vaginalis (strain ATCC PRA-98 / G3) TaxID=412133 RepID=UPI0021E56E92|nr:MULE transposase domain-containing protein [Trichomonas vaginalis G3]KAI5494598.1 MULE transposase domain-containing protein [Trichomonas vaginalis G3]
MSAHVKINDENKTPWEDIIDDIENDLDENMMGVQTSVKVKLVSIHIKGTEALRSTLPIICEFDTLQNR